MTLRTYIDRGQNGFVKAKADATPIILAPFYQSSEVRLEVFVLEPNPTGGISNPYTVLDVTGKSLRVGLGDPKGTATPMAQTLSFSVGTSGSDKYFFGQFSLATTEINNFIGAELEKETYLEIEISDDGITWDKLIQVTVKIRATLFDGTATPVVGPCVLIQASDSPYTPADNARTVFVINDGAISFLLPSAVPDGRRILVKCLGDAATYPVTITCPSADLESGTVASVVLNMALDWAEFVYQAPEDNWLLCNRRQTPPAAASFGPYDAKFYP